MKKILILLISVLICVNNFALSSSLSSVPPKNKKKWVTVYLLIEKSAQLRQYMDDLTSVSKVNFNRIVFSFVKPTLTKYKKGSLANTGIMGYFDEGDKAGEIAFKQLKEAVKASKLKGIQTFLSVGGWNYSCNYAVYGQACGEAPSLKEGMHYDWFPDPNDSMQTAMAKTAYNNLIDLAVSLGVDGIDLDYEEFWHADQNAVRWNGDPWATEIANNIKANGGPTYLHLISYASGGSTTSGPAVMPKTIDKMAAIIHLLEENPLSKGLLFSTAAPPVGARPITGFVYGAPDRASVDTFGGLWWLGNLAGLWYNLTDKEKTIVDRFDSIGLMTYDLCGDNIIICAPYGGGPLTLDGQVDAYVQDYLTWLKSDAPVAADLKVSSIGKVTFLPAKYRIHPDIQFGFEINQPAYPKDPRGQLQLTNALVDRILAQQKDRTNGVIIWQLYSVQNKAIKDAAITKDTLNKSCAAFLADDSRYDCQADFPSMANPNEVGSQRLRQ